MLLFFFYSTDMELDGVGTELSKYLTRCAAACCATPSLEALHAVCFPRSSKSSSPPGQTVACYVTCNSTKRSLFTVVQEFGLKVHSLARRRRVLSWFSSSLVGLLPGCLPERQPALHWGSREPPAATPPLLPTLQGHAPCRSGATGSHGSEPARQLESLARFVWPLVTARQPLGCG